MPLLMFWTAVVAAGLSHGSSPAELSSDGALSGLADQITDELPDASVELSQDVDRWALIELWRNGPAQTPRPATIGHEGWPQQPRRPSWQALVLQRRLWARLSGAPEQHHAIDPARLDLDIPIAEHPLVDLYIDYFTGRGRLFFERWLQRSARFRPLMEEILVARGLPRDLIFVAMVESGFSAQAVSSASAVGYWQFMAPTARLYGLRRTAWQDERRDFVRATEAAAGYLTQLYRTFGDWHLAWAGYNAGEGRIRRALAKSGTSNFWALIEGRHGLAKETVHYVPKIIAAALIAKDAQRYGFVVPTAEAPLVWDEIPIERPIDLRRLAQRSGVGLEALRALNPGLLHDITPPGLSHPLRVPPGLGPALARQVASMPTAQRLTYWQHKVRHGETLSGIARAYHADMRAVAEMNQLRPQSMLRAGRTLIVPAVPAAPTPSRLRARSRGQLARAATIAKQGAPRTSHKVAAGDTLWGIARRYGVSVKRLQATNALSGARRLSIGDVIDIF